MTRSQTIAQAIADAGGWIASSAVAARLNLSQNLVAAVIANLRRKYGFVESEPMDGDRELRHRIADAAAAGAYVSSSRKLGRPAGSGDLVPRKRRRAA